MRRVVLALFLLTSNARADDTDPAEKTRKTTEFNEAYAVYWGKLREFNACMEQRAKRSDAALDIDNVNERRNAVLALPVCERPQVPALVPGATYGMPDDAEKQALLEVEHYEREMKEYQLTFTVGGTKPVYPGVDKKRVTIVDCTEVTEDLVQIPNGPAVPVKSVVRELNVNSTDAGCAEKRAADATHRSLVQRQQESRASSRADLGSRLAGHVTLGGEFAFGTGYYGGFRVHIAGAYRLLDQGLDIGVGASLVAGAGTVDEEAEEALDFAALGPEIQLGARFKATEHVHNRVYLSYSPMSVWFDDERTLGHRIGLGLTWIGSLARLLSHSTDYGGDPDAHAKRSDDFLVKAMGILFPQHWELVFEHRGDTRVGFAFGWGI